MTNPQKTQLWADLLKYQPHSSLEESKSRSDRIKHFMRGFRATVDSPGCDIYPDLMALFPEAKVILSVRDSDDTWWMSFSDTLGVKRTRRYQWLTYPIAYIRHDLALIQALHNRWMRVAGTNAFGPVIHRAHNEDVQSNVPSEKLLVYNVKMGWKPLCDFLKVPVPEQPFPHLSVMPKSLDGILC